ncbi:MAG: response regulator [Marinilabiliaceae bacterium]|nr:response regulator [Marinilabiliaceae bacterium]
MHRILIVDDEKPAREFIAHLVSSFLENSKIVQIDNPIDALNKLQKDYFDLLFLDICMPDMTGLELLEKIQQAGKFPYTVIISAHREFDYAVKGIELKVVQYITKPLYNEKIRGVINNYLKYIKEQTLELKFPRGTLRIKHDRIVAIETLERTKVKIYTTNEVISFVTGHLSKFFEILPKNFRYIRRDCILNFNLIDDYNNKSKEVEVNTAYGKLTFAVSRDNMKKIVKRSEEISG